jgi:holo-[acyl-carrier protein] synthase
MIIGVGVDIVDICRVRTMLEQPTGQRFIERVLTAAERELAGERRSRLAEFVAGRFAAKEAVVKALGCGIGQKAGFHDVEILSGRQGEPLCAVSQGALERLGLSEDMRIHLSISHSETAAVAYAVAEAL